MGFCHFSIVPKILCKHHRAYASFPCTLSPQRQRQARAQLTWLISFLDLLNSRVPCAMQYKISRLERSESDAKLKTEERNGTAAVIFSYYKKHTHILQYPYLVKRLHLCSLPDFRFLVFLGPVLSSAAIMKSFGE